MSDSAALSSDRLLEVMQLLPEYDRYEEATDSYQQESPYRLAIGRHLKEWGDRLLDIAEFQGGYLTAGHTRVLDHLVGRVAEILGLLNCTCRVVLPQEDPDRKESLRNADTNILRLIEEAGLLIEGARRDELAASWLEAEARAFHQSVRTLRREIERRNSMLGVRPGRQILAEPVTTRPR